MKRSKTRAQVVTQPHRQIPEPVEKNFATGLVFLIGSFFNNTQAFDIEHQDRDSRFAVRYRGYGYRPHKRRNRK